MLKTTPTTHPIHNHSGKGKREGKEGRDGMGREGKGKEGKRREGKGREVREFSKSNTTHQEKKLLNAPFMVMEASLCSWLPSSMFYSMLSQLSHSTLHS